MHACIGNIQEQFSIIVPRTDSLYEQIIALFYDVMNVQAEGRFAEIVEDRNIYDNMLVPFGVGKRRVMKCINCYVK